MKDTRKYCINVLTGVLLLRNSETARIPVVYRNIDNKLAEAIIGGKITASEAAKLIKTADAQKKGFDWDEYDETRRKAKEMLNVSSRNMIPVKDSVEEDNPEGEPSEEISADDLGVGNKPKEKKSKADKPKEEKSEPEESAVGVVAGEDAGEVVVV